MNGRSSTENGMIFVPTDIIFITVIILSFCHIYWYSDGVEDDDDDDDNADIRLMMVMDDKDVDEDDEVDDVGW